MSAKRTVNTQYGQVVDHSGPLPSHLQAAVDAARERVASGGGPTATPTPETADPDKTPMPSLLPTNVDVLQHGMDDEKVKLGSFAAHVPTPWVAAKIEDATEAAGDDGILGLGFVVLMLTEGKGRKAFTQKLLANPGDYIEQAEELMDSFPVTRMGELNEDFKALMQSISGGGESDGEGKVTGSSMR